MNPLESTRAELYHAALHYTWARTRHDIDGEVDDDRMVSVIARLEVAAKAFAKLSEYNPSHHLISASLDALTQREIEFLKEIERRLETKTPPGNHSGGAT